MANPRFNKQVTNRRGAMGGGRDEKNGWRNDEGKNVSWKRMSGDG